MVIIRIESVVTSWQLEITSITSTSQVVLHHFGIKDSIKDITLEEIFKIMYKNDFSEPALPSSGIMMSSNEVPAED